MSRFHAILVPTDFGPSSEEATRLAIDLASQFGAELTLLHVWDAPAYVYSAMVGTADPVEPFRVQAETNLARALAAVQAQLPRAKSALIAHGDAAAGIQDVIADLRTDLVVMGTRGRAGIARAVLGSVAERTVRTSPVPVLTVHARTNELQAAGGVAGSAA